MDKHKQPRTIEAATPMCERYAETDGQIKALEQRRNMLIARLNGLFDNKLLPLVDERDAIAEKLRPWWMKARDKLLTGKAKSKELGGCIVGTKKGKDTLDYSGDHDKPVDAFAGLRWAKAFIRVTESVDAAATMRGLEGKHEKKLADLGFSKKIGEDVFFIKRTEQGQTVGKAS